MLHSEIFNALLFNIISGNFMKNRLLKAKHRFSHAGSTSHLCPLSKDPVGPSLSRQADKFAPDSLTYFLETGSRFSVSFCSLFPSVCTRGCSVVLAFFSIASVIISSFKSLFVQALLDDGCL
ncbi:Hypothetical_protein [Hexamita inflata]|uniref:Hypothetical_protein n=1 Tax=Hexamita inflata TaxID=28002 RepID=A0AA86NT05_9EUKA|nr:Hypothetical protein HINF_LOCUS13150 [Hexamita inflata]